MSVSKITLGELAKEVDGSIQTGPFGSQLHQSDYQEEGTPVVMPQDIKDDRLSTESIARISDEMVRKLARHQLKIGDIIYPRRGDLNKRAIITEEYEGWLCGTGCLKISVSGGSVDSKYLFYFLKQPRIASQIEQKAVGATMLNLNTKIVSDLEITYPSLPEQKRIADILSAYDDLIDNNNRRIALLEEAIHRLYREWFVHLRFPGHEHIPVVAGVPEGWEKRPIGKLLDFHIGGGWGKETPESDFTDPAFVIRGTDIDSVFASDTSNVPFRYHKESNLRSRKLQDGDIVFEVSGGSKTQGVGRTLLINEETLKLFAEDVMCASFCKLMRPKTRELSEYLTFFLLANREAGNLQAYENQSASNIINFKFTAFLKGMLVLLPSTKVLDKFNDFAKPILAQITNLGIQNNRLREARDALLPRLMNGSLPV